MEAGEVAANVAEGMAVQKLMTMLSRWIPLCIAFAATMTALLKVNLPFERLKKEINALG